MTDHSPHKQRDFFDADATACRLILAYLTADPDAWIATWTSKNAEMSDGQCDTLSLFANGLMTLVGG
jgi:hypothetical protein